MGAGQILTLCAVIVGTTGACAAVWSAGKWLFATLRKLARLADDLLGEPARPGHPTATPGVLDRLSSIEAYVSPLPSRLDDMDRRLAAVEAQLQPNGGTTLRDALDRLAGEQPESPHGGAQ